MTEQKIKDIRLLTYAGTLPFIACAMAMFLKLHIDGLNFAHISSAYSAVIISFICGIHWAIYAFHQAACPRYVVITSNIIALLAWVNVLIPPCYLSYAVNIASFIILLMIDQKIYHQARLPPWYYPLRFKITIVVISSLCLTALFV
ncbi:MAG: DUF3429 domain-containing protein [Alphaproteobacteria bacterium]|nr:DUF3429 domain-containing protein [Alphaproteobacteria bacterium]